MNAPTDNAGIPAFIPMADVPAAVSRLTGRKPSRSTLCEWIKGRRGVLLQTWKFGRQRYTTEAALIEYARQLAAPAKPANSPTDPAMPAARRKQILDAMATLERHRVRPALGAATSRKQ